MTLLLIAVAGGVIAGLVRPRLGARAVRLRLHRPWLLGLGAALNLASLAVGDDLAVVAVGASLVSLLAFALANPHITGIAVVGLGLLVNLAALVANNGMPVRPAALVEAGLATEDELPTLTVDPPRHLETSADRFAVLGDVLPLAPLNEVVSFGDLIVVAGAADAVRELARRRRPRWNDRDVASYVSATTAARVAQDWGAAPSGAPVSGSQCSEKSDRVAPVTSAEPMADAMSSSPALAAASHNR